MLALVYGVLDMDGEWTGDAETLLIVVAAAASLAAGLSVGRWWALSLPLLVVLFSVPAGHEGSVRPDETDNPPIWLFLVWPPAAVATALIAIGVAARRLFDRHG